MFQQTHSVQDHNNKTVLNATPRYGQFFIKILQDCFRVIRKIAATAAIGFHIFVQNAEQPNLPHHEYWWDSPDSVDELLKP